MFGNIQDSQYKMWLNKYLNFSWDFLIFNIYISSLTFLLKIPSNS